MMLLLLLLLIIFEAKKTFLEAVADADAVVVVVVNYFRSKKRLFYFQKCQKATPTMRCNVKTQCNGKAFAALALYLTEISLDWSLDREQCDQIWLFVKGLGGKFSFQNCPNIGQRFRYFEKGHFLK